jgi:hypothetical protein
VAAPVAGARLRRRAPERPWPPPLPASQERFRPAYEAFAAGLLADRGGSEAVTTAELVLIEATAECYVVARKLARRLTTRGVTKRRGEEQPALKAYFTALNTLRLNLMSLGLGRRARQIPSLAAYVAEHERPEGRPEAAGAVPRPEVPAEPPACNGNTTERERDPTP